MSSIFKIGYLKELLLFIVVFCLNIGLKEIFRLTEDFTMYVILVILLSITFFIFFINVPPRFLEIYTYSTFFYIYLVLMSFGSMNIEYGLMKAFLGILTPLLCFRIFITNGNWTEKNVIKYLLITVFIIDLIGIIYKIKAGFFIRGVSYGLLGPIPFGWINGMALVAAAQKEDKGIGDLLVLFFFLLMIIWTGSKGPLLSFLVTSILTFRKILGNSMKTRIIILLFLLAGTIFIITYGENIRAVSAVMALLENPDEYKEGAGSGSIGSREEYLFLSLEKISENPIFGVGFGDWNTSSFIFHQYPHNIYLEILSEIGIIGFLLFIILVLKSKIRSTFGYVTLFSLIAMCFSGDVSYFRYTFLPLLFSYYFKTQEKSPTNIAHETD